MPEIKYDKLSEQLERMIRDGAFGNRLPGIHKLAGQLGANHITVRKALELLIDRGLLEVIPSRGTFVREQEKAVRNFHVIGCIGVCCSSHVREMVFNRQNELMRESGYKMLDISASSKIFRENPRLLLQFPVDGYIFFGSSLVVIVFARMLTVEPLRLTFAPIEAASSSIFSTSMIVGTLCRMTSSSVSMAAAIIGRTAFLFPPTVIEPLIRLGPSMTRLFIIFLRLIFPRDLQTEFF